MVSFSCENCGDILTKKKLDAHRMSCIGASFTCLNCMVHFQGTEYRNHTSCTSEAQKYQELLFQDTSAARSKPHTISTSSDPAYPPSFSTFAANSAIPGVPIPTHIESNFTVESSEVNVFGFLTQSNQHPSQLFTENSISNSKRKRRNAVSSASYSHSSSVPANDTPPIIESRRVDPYTIKCICNYSDDDGNMILCEICDTRQHIECFYPGRVEDASKEEFDHVCADCKPRPLDRQHAIERQRQHRQNKLMNENGDKKTKRSSEEPFLPHMKGRDDASRKEEAEEGLALLWKESAESDEDEDDPYNADMFVTPDEEAIVPNYEGFKAHIRRLNPVMEIQYNWLVSRLAHQQETRYKNLLDLRVRHSQSISQCNCQAGLHCLALGGSSILLDPNGNLKKSTQIETNFFDESNRKDGVLTEETFSPGVPMPPTNKLPAEFECQICFKAKKFLKPSDWTKHVHEDVQPFTCTWERCRESKSFKRRADWVRHENERHRHLEWWVCQIDDCRHPCYRKDNFIQHLVREHKLPEPKQKTKVAIKQAQLTEPAWIMLEQCHHETTARSQDESCKFCGKAFLSWKMLTVHLAKHMEHIALPILRLVELKAVDANTIVPPIEQLSVSTGPPVDKISGIMADIDDPFSDTLPENPILNPILASYPIQDLNHQESNSREHYINERDWDLASLASLNTYRDSALGSSVPSNNSSSVLEGLPRTAQEEVVFILNSDSKLRSLFQQAARRTEKARFVRNVRRLFILFHKDLQDSAVDPREKDAASIVKKHAEWLASRLFDVCDPKKDTNFQAMATHLNQQVDKRSVLEQYLASMRMSGNRLDAAHTQPFRIETNSSNDLSDSEEGSSFDDDESVERRTSEEIIDYSNFPNLEHIRRFLVGGTAFENLRRNTSQFVQPEAFDPQILSPSTSRLQDKEVPQESWVESELDSSLTAPHITVSPDSTASAAPTEVTTPEVENDSEDGWDLSSDPELYDNVAEDRILNPKAYFDKLKSMEREIFNNSAISVYKTGFSNGAGDDNFFLRIPEYADNSIETERVVSLIKSTGSWMLLQLLECHNYAFRIGASLLRLQETGYCTSQISLLVLAGSDRSNVTKLVQVDIEEILNLRAAFGGLLSALISRMSLFGRDSQESIHAAIKQEDLHYGVTVKCTEMLLKIGLSPYVLSNGEQHVLWECAVQTLELGVLSYAGAHIERFDQDLPEVNIDLFKIPRRFMYHDLVLRGMSPWDDHEIHFRRRRLQCLDKFLGEQQPWVFHRDFSTGGNQRLFLSASIQALTDLWGPSWKIIHDSEPGKIQRLDIGNGAIIPWTSETTQGQKNIEKGASEVFCHWISFKDWNDAEIEAYQASAPRNFLLETDTLLIGATNNLGLVLNPDCTSSIERLLKVKTKFSELGALRELNTFRSVRYVESHSVQVQGSALGFFTAGDTITYKRRSGQTMKDALVERWRHGLRNPMDLESFSGVEISLCSRNARRRRLLHLLGSSTMQNYLHGITFKWISDDCERAYFQALRSPKRFRKFWKENKEYLENVGDAISKCLDALEETGIEGESRELRGLWVESFDIEGESDGESDDDEDSKDDFTPTAVTQLSSHFFEEWIVTLFRSEHTWTGFLQDSEESLTMAVLGTACLDFDHGGYGRRCSQARTLASNSKSGYPVLETSIQLNSSLLSSTKLTQEIVDSGKTTIWNAKELNKGTTFPLGDHGSLKVLAAANRVCPAIMEWHGVKSETMKEIKNVAINEKLLGENKEKHHKEYMRGKWEAKPLPILVLSKSTHVTCSKE